MSDGKMLRVLIKLPKGMLIKTPKEREDKKNDNKKLGFLQLFVEAAMKKENMDIDADVDDKLMRKINDMREKIEEIENMRKRKVPILGNPQQSKKRPRFPSSCQPPLMEKKEAAYFKEVVEVDDDDDYDYEKEVMKKKKKKAMKSSTIDEKKKKKKKKKDIGSSSKASALPPLPLPNEEVCKLMLYRISEIGGTCPVWLAAKYMEKSDVNSHLGRLFIPKCCADVLLNFLTQQEKDFLMEEDKKIVKEGIPCRVVDQNGGRWDLRLRYWPSVKQFIFIRNWNSVVKGFDLKIENPGKIELWCFRLHHENLSLSFGLRITS